MNRPGFFVRRLMMVGSLMSLSALLVTTSASIAAARPTTRANQGHTGRGLRAVPPDELAWYGYVAPRASYRPATTRARALAVVTEARSGLAILGASLAMASVGKHGCSRRIPIWVVKVYADHTLLPLVRTRPVGPACGDRRSKSLTRGFILEVVDARTGRFSGEVLGGVLRGHFYLPPCSIDLTFDPRVYRYVAGRWQAAPTVWDASISRYEPVIYAGQRIRFVLNVAPGYCFDRYSTARLYFRKSFVSSNGEDQFRNQVGPSQRARARLSGGSWRFTWTRDLVMRPKSHLLLASWDVTTSGGQISPDLLIHVRFPSHAPAR